jgi:peroxiredoxin
VSVDTPYSQWNWLESLGKESGGKMVAKAPGEIPGLVLLSDRNGELMKAYGVDPLVLDGFSYASRSTFVIDKKGILRYVNYDYNVRDDYAPLLEALKGLE